MLEFKMKGYPRPNIKWTKVCLHLKKCLSSWLFVYKTICSNLQDGQPLAAGDRHKFVYPDQESVALIISKVAPEDVGTYKVTLSNDLGQASTEGKLALSGAPQFIDKIEDQKTGIGKKDLISFTVVGQKI